MIKGRIIFEFSLYFAIISTYQKEIKINMKSIIIEFGKFAWNGSVINSIVPCASMEIAKKLVKEFIDKIPKIDDVTDYTVENPVENAWILNVEMGNIKEESFVRIVEYDVIENVSDFFKKELAS